MENIPQQFLFVPPRWQLRAVGGSGRGARDWALPARRRRHGQEWLAVSGNSAALLSQHYGEVVAVNHCLERRKTSRIPGTNIAAVGGQPGMYPSTRSNVSPGPTIPFFNLYILPPPASRNP